MKKRFTVVAVAALALLSLAAVSCVIESERPVIRGPWIDQQGDYITGWVDVQTPGYMRRPISVQIWLNPSGRIGAVEFDLSSDTQSHVGPLPAAITPIILLTNSFNFPVSIVSGATGTALRLRNAVRDEFIDLGVDPDEIGF
ncbi:MAG: hypothetical protein FWC64_13450 [Treponema sp.]|nr:hypothetical protein [Treponema sp.]